MIKRAFFFIFIALSQVGSSQGILSFVKWEADTQGPEKFDRIIVDYTWNQWQKSPENITQRALSFGFSASWFRDIPLGKKSNSAIALGLGVESMSFHHDGEFQTLDNNGTSITQLIPLSNFDNVLKNKYSVTYIDLPIEFRIRTINKTIEDRMSFNFKLYLGFRAGILVSDHTKNKNNLTKVKVYNLPNTLPYRYGPYVRIGFNKIGFVGYYSLTSIFDDNSVNLTPFSLGLTWMRF
tara:strand:- start:323 stop:1033 length:711 start_codon:yes stop_codon:yes gene_type:complete